ncbi:MAG: type IV secretory system conjugative DNA transfer family protein [Caedimonadaceae bacterium]|nr:MAG: type IV secretory system conjugative DNA transfer family protein [Caedimonadaceae bacterium]
MAAKVQNQTLLGSAFFSSTKNKEITFEALQYEGDMVLLGRDRGDNEDVAAWKRAIPNNVLLSYDDVRSTVSLGYNDQFEAMRVKRHLITVAATRSGKGTQLIIPNLLTYKGSCVVIDPKGENAYITAPQRRRMGQKVFVLDPWGEVNRRYGALSGEKEEIATFNPLSILDPTSKDFGDDVDYIADSLIINNGGGDGKHFDDSARELVAGLIAYAVLEYGKAASLPLVRLLLTKDAEAIAGLAEKAKEFGEDSLAARKLARFKVTSKELASVISTAQTQSGFLDSDWLTDNLASENTFSFDELIDGATIYLVLPTDKLQTKGRWLRLMISIGIRAVARNVKPLSLPVLFMLDEFGTIGRLSAVAQAVGLMAGLNMRIWAFIQDLTQLKRDYPDDWESFIANSDALISFDAMDQTTTEYISKLLGRETVWETVQSSSGGTSTTSSYSSGQNDSWSSGSSTTTNFGFSSTPQVFARELMTPDEVRRLGSDQGIIITRDFNVQYHRNHYFDDPHLSELARVDPTKPYSRAKTKLKKEHWEAARNAWAVQLELERERERERWRLENKPTIRFFLNFWRSFLVALLIVGICSALYFGAVCFGIGELDLSYNLGALGGALAALTFFASSWYWWRYGLYHWKEPVNLWAFLPGLLLSALFLGLYIFYRVNVGPIEMNETERAFLWALPAWPFVSAFGAWLSAALFLLPKYLKGWLYSEEIEQKKPLALSLADRG